MNEFPESANIEFRQFVFKVQELRSSREEAFKKRANGIERDKKLKSKHGWDDIIAAPTQYLQLSNCNRGRKDVYGKELKGYAPVLCVAGRKDVLWLAFSHTLTHYDCNLINLN